jgi:putative ABC transport system permease protein
MLVLLIACANVANLMLARTAERQREIATRQALGASRARLVRQFLTETSLLGLLGGVAGLLSGYWASPIMRAMMVGAMPEQRTFVQELHFGPDWRVAIFALCIALACGMIFGMAPAFELLRSSLSPGLKDDAMLGGTRVRRSRLRNALIIGQVAISVCLTIAAALCVRSVHRALTREYDFATRNVLLVEMRLPYDSTHTREFHRRILERISALPGIESIGMTSLPEGGQGRNPILVEGRESQPMEIGFHAQDNFYTPGYFTTLQIPILQGRNFTDDDLRSQEPIAIISESMARQCWPTENALGKRLRLGHDAPLLQVIGIAKDGMPPELWKTAPGGLIRWYTASFAGDLYLPLRPDNPNLNIASVVARVATSNPRAMIPLVKSQVLELDPQIEVSVNVLRKLMDSDLEGPLRMIGFAASGLGLLALTLAIVGIYGVMAYAVSRRTHEIGVRMALGAGRTDVLRMILQQGMRVVGLGVVAGFACAVGVARLMASQLFGMSPIDPVSFGSVTLLAVSAALLACYVPARRAAKVDPMVALRSE